MSTRNPSDEETLNRVLEYHQAQIHTMMPGYIEAWHEATLTADVTPVFTDYFETDGDKPQAIPYPKLMNVPIAYPCGGDFSIVWPLKKGDPVSIWIMQRSLEEWFNSNGGQQLAQADIRMHSLSDAIIYPGLMPDGKRTTAHTSTDMVFGMPDGAKVRYGNETAAKALALAEKVNTELQAIVTQFNIHFHPSPFMVPVTIMQGPGDTSNERVFTDA